MLGALAGLPSLGGLGGFGGGGALPLLGFTLLGTLTSQLSTRAFLGERTEIPSWNTPDLSQYGNLSGSFGNYLGTSSPTYGSYTATGSYPNINFASANASAIPASHPYSALSWYQHAAEGGPHPSTLPHTVNYGQPYTAPPAYAAPVTPQHGTYGAYTPPPVYATAGYSTPTYGSAPQAYATSYGQGYSDLTYRLPSLPIPAYNPYQSNYASLPPYNPPTYGATSYEASSVAWSYPQQPGPFYALAQPSYTQNVMHSQSPYGYGGAPRPAPTAPPAYVHPKPPAAQPAYQAPVSVPPAVDHRDRIGFKTVPQAKTPEEYAKAAEALKARMTGDPARIEAFADCTPNYKENKDALHIDRKSAYAIMQQDDTLCLDVNSGKFYRSYDDGQRRDVLSLAQVSSIMRQPHPDNHGRVAQLMAHLPNDSQLLAKYGSTMPTIEVAGVPSQPAYLPPIQHGAPAYGAPAYGAPAYGAPAYGAPAYGAPAYGAPAFGAPAYGAPAYGAPAYGAPAYGAPAYGAPAYAPPAYGAPAYAPPAYGAPAYGTPAPGPEAPPYTPPAPPPAPTPAPYTPPVAYEPPAPPPTPAPTPAPPPVAVQPPAPAPVVIPPVQMPVLPPQIAQPTIHGANPTLDALLNARNAGSISSQELNLGLIGVARDAGVLKNAQQVAQNTQASGAAPFTVTAHRYWDANAGGYVNVREVAINGGIDPNDVERRYNTNGLHTVDLTQDKAAIGKPLRVTVLWENGTNRVWDYTVADANGREVDVFSPIG